MKKKEYDAILIEKEETEGLTKTDILNIYDLLRQPEGFPVEIDGNNSSAMGFITPYAAEIIDFMYDESSEFGKFISSILADMDLETESGEYEFEGLKIFMYRD